MKPFKQTIRLSIPELLRCRATVASYAAGYGMTTRVLNNGQHWEFKRQGLLVEWWPSTGSLMVNKRGGRQWRLHTIQDLRALIEREIEATLAVTS